MIFDSDSNLIFSEDDIVINNIWKLISKIYKDNYEDFIKVASYKIQSEKGMNP